MKKFNTSRALVAYFILMSAIALLCSCSGSRYHVKPARTNWYACGAGKASLIIKK